MPSAIDPHVIRRFTTGELDLPLLPALITQLLAATQDPDADIREMEHLVCQDGPLAAHVLRVANAPAFAGQRQLTSIREAITRIGTRALVRIAITARLSKLYFVPGSRAASERIRRHAQLTGVYAVELSRLMKTDPEQAFLCGLLHTIGKPVVLRTVVTAAADLEVSLEASEIQQWLAEWYVSVGARLVQGWQLPRVIQEAVTFHDRPQLATDFPREVQLTSLASTLALAQTRDRSEQPGLVKAHPAVSSLSLEIEPLVAILGKSRLVQQAEALALRPAADLAA